ncbi:hypothetical protein ACFL7M_01655 [Thermodesulfobacteriota bacterium]
MKVSKQILLFLILLSILTSASQSRSEDIIRIDVRTILASQEKGSIDPRLKDLTKELQSVFRYSSYRLLRQDRLNFNQKKSGKVSLPDNRVMNIISKGVSRNRVTLELEIYKTNSQIFQTVIHLRNNSSITIGGPKYEGGNLLFIIFTSF